MTKATNVKFDEKNSEPKKDLRNKAHDVLFRIISTGARWATGQPLFFCMFFLRQAWYTFKRRWNSTRQASSNSKSANKDVLLKNWQATLKKTLKTKINYCKSCDTNSESLMFFGRFIATPAYRITCVVSNLNKYSCLPHEVLIVSLISAYVHLRIWSYFESVDWIFLQSKYYQNYQTALNQTDT